MRNKLLRIFCLYKVIMSYGLHFDKGCIKLDLFSKAYKQKSTSKNLEALVCLVDCCNKTYTPLFYCAIL